MRYQIRNTEEYLSVKNKLRETSRNLKNRKISLCLTLRSLKNKNNDLEKFNSIIDSNKTHSISFIKKQIKKKFENVNLSNVEKYILTYLEYNQDSRKTFEERRKCLIKNTAFYCTRLAKAKHKKNLKLESIALMGLNQICNSLKISCSKVKIRLSMFVNVIKKILNVDESLKVPDKEILDFYKQNIKKIILPEF